MSTTDPNLPSDLPTAPTPVAAIKVTEKMAAQPALGEPTNGTPANGTSTSGEPADVEAVAADASTAEADGRVSRRRQRATPGRLLASTMPPTVDDDLTEQDLRHESRMTSRFGLLLGLMARILFKPVDYPARHNNDVTDCAREGVPVYVMNTVSKVDYLYFNYALRRAGAPLAEFANGVHMAFFHPWRGTLAFWWRRIRGHKARPDDEVVRGLLRRRRSVLLFLRGGFSFAPLVSRRPQDTHLREVIAVQRHASFPIFIVPQMLIWERRPGADRGNILDAFFGDPDAPGPIRKAFSFVFNHRRAFVRLGEIIDVRQFIAEHSDGLEDGLLAERLRERILQHYAREERVIRGGQTKSPQQIASEILGDAQVDGQLRELARAEQRDWEAVEREARTSLLEIAADMRLWVVELFCLILTLVWARIYEGIELDEDGLERLREAGREAPVVVVPSHKSHIDYLIVSYLFYRNGLIPPHIAAGANLSFWPMGTIFRLSGAFFLRRSFKGQPVYAACFRAYVRKLLRDGNWMEFFIEGTRSRTGKLQPPRYGLLRLIAEAVADGEIEDVALAPVNFGYERLIEERSYRKELEGGEKRSEGVGDLLGATQVLIHKYGRMRVQFSEILSMRAELERQGVVIGAADPNDKALQRAIQVCGYQLLNGINAASVLTPTALVAAVLLSKVNRGISREDLLLRCGYLLDTAARRGAVLSGPLQAALRSRRQKLSFASTQDLRLQRESGGLPDPLGKQAERARLLGQTMEPFVDGALRMFEGGKWVVRKPFGDHEVYVVKRAGRLHLDYYKNNIIHVFVPNALFAAGLLSVLGPNNTCDRRDLSDAIKFLSVVLKFEFVYDPGVSFEQQYAASLDQYVEMGWLKKEGEDVLRLRDKVTKAVHIYAKLVQNFIESYMLMGKALTALSQGPMTDKAFIDHCQKQAAHLFELGEVQCYESCSKVNLSNALKIFIEQRYIQERREQQGKRSVRLLDVEVGERTGAQFATFVDRIESFHRPWRVGQR